MVMNNLSIIVRHSRVCLERKLQELDIGYAEEVIISYLYDKDPITQDNIAKYFMLDKGTIAKTINKMEEKALIVRSENPENKREKLVCLTEKGINIMDSVQTIIQDWHQETFQGLTQEDIKQFSRIIEIMATNVTNSTSVAEKEPCE